MNDRNKAINILQRAKERLAERLTERIVESEEEVIDDADGQSYLSEIATIYDDVGSRLTNVAQMLNHLPKQEEPEAEPVEAPLSEPLDEERSERAPTPGPLALPDPTVGRTPVLALSPPSGAQPSSSFQSLLQHIHAGEIDGAGRQLADLLGVTDRRGRQCAIVFQQRLEEDPDFLAEAMKLRYEVTNGSANGVLMLLSECFGLQITEALSAYETIKAQNG